MKEGLGSSLIETFAPFIERITSFVIGIFFVKKYVQTSYTINIIYDYLNSLGRGYGVSQEGYTASWEHIRPLGDQFNIWRKDKGNSTRLWFYKKRPIIFLPHYKDDEMGTSSFMFFRWTLNWTKLIKEAGEFRDQKVHATKVENPKFCIVRHSGSSKMIVNNNNDPETEAPSPSKKNISKEKHHDKDGELLFWNESDIGNPKPADPMGYLSINKPMAKVVRRVKFWFNNKEWYVERDIIWKLGVMLEGPPGSGKTSLIRAIAEELDLPLHIFDLATMDNNDFMTAWQSSQSDKPRVVVFEDWDTVFDGRENKVDGCSLEFGSILNAIDGLEREHGLLLFVTTNKIDSVDEALGRPISEGSEESTRPGRIDIIIKMKDLNRAGRVKIANRIFIDQPELAETMADRYPDDTAVKFQDRCMKLALAAKWGEVDDDDNDDISGRS